MEIVKSRMRFERVRKIIYAGRNVAEDYFASDSSNHKEIPSIK